MQQSKTTFWKTLRSADDTVRPKNSSTSTVPVEKWTEHFKTLYSDSNDVNDYDQRSIHSKLQKLENNSCSYHAILDRPIVYTEIVNALIK